MLKILKNKKGITLVELIVGMVVLAIILATVSAILFPMMRFQSRANELAEQNALLDDLANQIIYDLSMAISEIDPIPITLSTDEESRTHDYLIISIHGSVGGDVTYILTTDATLEETEEFGEGVILRQQGELEGEPVINPLLPGEFHMRMNRAGIVVETINIERIGGTEEIIYTLTLTLSNENLTFERSYAVRPLALN